MQNYCLAKELARRKIWRSSVFPSMCVLSDNSFLQQWQQLAVNLCIVLEYALVLSTGIVLFLATSWNKEEASVNIDP